MNKTNLFSNNALSRSTSQECESRDADVTFGVNAPGQLLQRTVVQWRAIDCQVLRSGKACATAGGLIVCKGLVVIECPSAGVAQPASPRRHGSRSSWSPSTSRGCGSWSSLAPTYTNQGLRPRCLHPGPTPPPQMDPAWSAFERMLDHS